jgi:hypothetical protein
VSGCGGGCGARFVSEARIIRVTGPPEESRARVKRDREDGPDWARAPFSSSGIILTMGRWRRAVGEGRRGAAT